jgi:hypothetical protein
MYLLETITCLELEASPELRETMLRASLVNVSGQAGSFCALDFMQEYLNRLLEAIVQCKGVDYGDTYIRTTISRNLHHFSHIKKELRGSVGLQVRSRQHTEPHTEAKMNGIAENDLFVMVCEHPVEFKKFDATNA